MKDYIRTVDPAEALRMIKAGQVESGEKPGKKIRAVYLTGRGLRPASPMSGVVKEPVESKNGGTSGFVYAMRLRTMNGSFNI